LVHHPIHGQTAGPAPGRPGRQAGEGEHHLYRLTLPSPLPGGLTGRTEAMPEKSPLHGRSAPGSNRCGQPALATGGSGPATQQHQALTRGLIAARWPGGQPHSWRGRLPGFTVRARVPSPRRTRRARG
jgi:hypothetical protein